MKNEIDEFRFSYTYCPIDIGFDNDTAKLIEVEIRNLEESEWYPTVDGFYGFDVFPVMERKIGITSSVRKFCPVLCNYLEEKLLPIVGDCRIYVSRTPPKSECNVHIGCHLKHVGTEYVKLRALISGEPDRLYFLDENRKSQKMVDGTGRSYVIDGGHPHWAPNDLSETRHILTIGNPWNGSDKKYVPFLDLKKAVTIKKPFIKRQWLHPNDPARKSFPLYLYHGVKAWLRQL